MSVPPKKGALIGGLVLFLVGFVGLALVAVFVLQVMSCLASASCVVTPWFLTFGLAIGVPAIVVGWVLVSHKRT